jgi:hypothetical protein
VTPRLAYFFTDANGMGMGSLEEGEPGRIGSGEFAAIWILA